MFLAVISFGVGSLRLLFECLSKARVRLMLLMFGHI